MLLFLAGFLPIRVVLYSLSDNNFRLIGVPVLVGAGIFNALTPSVIADIMLCVGVTTWRKTQSPL
jgi:hypothetical protein